MWRLKENMRRDRRRTIKGNGRMIPSEWFKLFLRERRLKDKRRRVKIRSK